MARSFHTSLYPALNVEDLEQTAAIALIHLYRRYDPSLNVPFGAYVRKRLNGLMIDELRKEEVKSRKGQARFTLSSVYVGYEDSGADHCPASSDQTERIPSGGPSAEDDCAVTQLRTRLRAAAAASLTDQEMRVFELLFFHDWTLMQVADELGVCESLVCKIKMRILPKLKFHLESTGINGISDVLGK